MTLDPLYVHDPAEVSRGIVFLSSCVIVCVAQYLSDVHANLSRGSGRFVPKVHSAIEHLTRSRAVSRTSGSFSSRFPSWPVRKGLPVSLYAISRKAVARITWSVPRLHTPSRGSLSATPRPIPAGVIGSVQVIACPSMCSLCSRKAICPENLATECRKARRVPTDHLASRSLGSRQPVPPRFRLLHVYFGVGHLETPSSFAAKRENDWTLRKSFRLPMALMIAGA